MLGRRGAPGGRHRGTPIIAVSQSQVDERGHVWVKLSLEGTVESDHFQPGGKSTPEHYKKIQSGGRG